MEEPTRDVTRSFSSPPESRVGRMCPWLITQRVLADHTEINDATPLFPDGHGLVVPQVKVIKAWMDHIETEMTGHSGRRSGAMWYARLGLPIHEIGTLGRWKLSAVFRYIEEALQDIPLNAGVTNLNSQSCPGTPAQSWAPKTPW